MTSAFSWQNSISLCPASFCIPRPNLPGIWQFLVHSGCSINVYWNDIHLSDKWKDIHLSDKWKDIHLSDKWKEMEKSLDLKPDPHSPLGAVCNSVCL